MISIIVTYVEKRNNKRLIFRGGARRHIIPKSHFSPSKIFNLLYVYTASNNIILDEL